MIVKVQISLYTEEAERQVLIQDENDDFVQILPLSKCPGLELAMADTRPTWRAFFDAKVVGGEIVLGARLPEQGW